MRAAIYNPYLDTMGGGERYSLTFAQVLLGSGWDVDLAWHEPYIKEKITPRFGLDLQNLKVVGDIKKGDGYDACFWVSDGSIPLLRARNNILHFQVPFTVSDGRNLINKMKFFRINHIVCNSFFTKNVIDKTYGVNSEVIYPPVDVGKIKPLAKKNIILAVGRFSQLKQAKRQDLLIEAFRKLYTKEKGFKLILAGGTEVGVGNYVDKLKKKAKDLPVEFFESPDHKTLIKLYGSTKYFWSAAGYGIDEEKDPEKVEHFGISPVEAMAAGAVPFLYNAGGHKEIVENEVNGYLWHNTNELVAETLAVVKDRAEYEKISKNAIERSKDFGNEKFAQKVLSII